MNYDFANLDSLWLNKIGKDGRLNNKQINIKNMEEEMKGELKNILLFAVIVFLAVFLAVRLGSSNGNLGVLSRTWNTPSGAGTFSSSTVNYETANQLLEASTRIVTIVCVPEGSDSIYLALSNSTSSFDKGEGILIEEGNCFKMAPPDFAWRGEIWMTASSTTSTVSYYYK